MALLPIRYQLAAVEEIDQAVSWYWQRSEKAANEFRRILRTKIAVRKSPNHWPLEPDGTRQIHLAPYPYVLVVREKHGAMEILAVAHTSRLPGYWRNRLE